MSSNRSILMRSPLRVHKSKVHRKGGHTLKQLIADFHDRDLPAFTPRHIRLPRLPGKIDTVIGMRRSGKTWFLFQVISDLLSKGRPIESILYLNLEDERLLPRCSVEQGIRSFWLLSCQPPFFLMRKILFGQNYPWLFAHLPLFCFRPASAASHKFCS